MSKKAAVIGAGFGGLAAAIRLQRLGFETTIFDNRDKPGGRAYVYERDGFIFDAGPTVVTAPEMLEDLFRYTRRDPRDYFELSRVEPFYRLFWEDGYQFDYGSDQKDLLRQIRERSEEDVEGYLRYLAYAEKVYEAGYVKLVDVPFLRFSDMLKVAPQLVKLKAYRSVYQQVSSYIKDERLREILSFNSLLIGGNPFRASSIYTLIHALEKKSGVLFPKGGTGALVRGLTKLFEDLGGRLELNSQVDRIVTANRFATGVTVGGKFLSFDLVVSNADVTRTYDYLLRDEPRVKLRARRLKASHHSMSLFVLYFGTNKDFTRLRHHNVMFANRYKELLTDIFDRGILADDFSLYVHAPTKTDPSLAPPGHHSFYALAPVPHLGKFSGDWNQLAQNYGDRILQYLEKHYMPELRQSIVCRMHLTPRDFSTEMQSHLGSAFSIEPRLTQSAWFRVHNQDPTIKNLFFVGAGTHPGAGIPGVIASAKATCDLIRDRLEQLYIPSSDLREVPVT